MAADVTIPRLGWSMEEGVFAGWLKEPGATVRPGEPLFMLEGEKATQEIEAVDGGVLHLAPDAPATGQTVPVGQLIARLCAAGETPTWAPSSGPAGGGAAPKPPAAPPRQEQASGSVRSSPRARRAARERGVDVSRVRGSGAGGRIRERDVLAVDPASLGGAAVISGVAVTGDAAVTVGPVRQPITQVRRTIARQMERSRQETVPVTLTAWADATALLAARAAAKAAAGAEAASLNDMLLVVLGRTLLDHPLLAARWEETHLALPGDRIDIGLAVDTPGGLVVPVVRDVAKTSLADVARQTRFLVDLGRAGRLAAADMQGGVFTLTSLGSYGIEFFTPVINHPEAAILGVGAIRVQPVPPPGGQEGFVLQRQLPLSLTFDHRIVDGGPAARFLGDLAARIAALPLEGA
jgi:pyruvate dehydrogenase E2 component (dihydrolipoamide acetyltransferase)